ncbi:ArsC family reductase [Vibrio algicola]|nr:ArsC family reductase [Vibrio algicola]
MITMYGIPNCDTIKKAKKWLEQTGIEFQFHDYRKQGIDQVLVQDFCQRFGWQQVLNKRGTTYRQLTQQQKDDLDESSAISLLIEYPAMIKRPIVISATSGMIGFKAEQYADFFK